MIEKPKRPKKIPNQDNKQPQNIEQLIRRYDLDNTKIYDFLDELVGSLNKKETYSIDEQAIGVWINGKLLYRKVIIGNITANANIRAVNNLLGNCDVCVNAYGMFDVQSSQGYCSINGSRLDSSGNELATSGVYLVNSTLMLATITNTDRNSAPYIITVEYTKTTD